MRKINVSEIRPLRSIRFRDKKLLAKSTMQENTTSGLSPNSSCAHSSMNSFRDIRHRAANLLLPAYKMKTEWKSTPFSFCDSESVGSANPYVSQKQRFRNTYGHLPKFIMSKSIFMQQRKILRQSFFRIGRVQLAKILGEDHMVTAHSSDLRGNLLSGGAVVADREVAVLHMLLQSLFLILLYI